MPLLHEVLHRPEVYVKSRQSFLIKPVFKFILMVSIFVNSWQIQSNLIIGKDICIQHKHKFYIPTKKYALPPPSTVIKNRTVASNYSMCIWNRIIDVGCLSFVYIRMMIESMMLKLVETHCYWLWTIINKPINNVVVITIAQWEN
jgi:hypothetical protein